MRGPLPGGWTLRQTHWCGLHSDKNRGTSFQTFALVSPMNAVVEQPDWEWADFDFVRNRVVWTAICILFAANLSTDGIGMATMLIDTQDMQFEPREAPY